MGRPEDANISLLDRLSVYGRKALRIVATGARFAGGIRRRNPRKVGFFLCLAGAGLAGIVLASFVGALLYVYYGLDLPDHRHLATYEPPGVTQVDADGGERRECDEKKAAAIHAQHVWSVQAVDSSIARRRARHREAACYRSIGFSLVAMSSTLR